jgi:hypothetical protein
MRVTFRRASKRDLGQWDWTPHMYWADTTKVPPHVVTVDGEIVVAFGKNGQVVFQNGTDGVAHLIRAWWRVVEALNVGATTNARAEARSREIWEDFHRIVREAEAKQ